MVQVRRVCSRIAIAGATLGVMLASGAAQADPGPAPPAAETAADAALAAPATPMPASTTRSFSTDRPTKSYVPYTVDQGPFQYETDLAVYAVARQDGADIRTWTIVDPTLKLGLTHAIDIEVQATPFEGAVIRTGSRRSAVSGCSDSVVRLKINLIGNDGGTLAIAVMPYVKVPTARSALGNGAVEGGLITPISIALPQAFTLVLSPEIDELHNAQARGYHRSANILANLSHPVGKRWTLYAEAFATRSFERGDSRVYTLDTAVAWAITPRLQWDAGANFKLGGVVPAAQIYTGLSQRF